MRELDNNGSNRRLVRAHAFICYSLMILGLFTGVFWLVGAVWAMVKKKDAYGTLYEGHYSNLIKIFWWGLILSVIGMVLAIFIVGYLVLFFAWVWSIYKLVKGFSKLLSDQPYHS